MNKKVLILVLTVILVLVISAVVFGLNKKPLIEPIIENTTPIETSTTTQKISSGINTSNWKTYTSEKGNFSISYPQNWNLELKENGFYIVSNDLRNALKDPFWAAIDISIRENKDNLFIEDWYIKNYPKNIEDIRDFIKISIIGADEAVERQIKIYSPPSYNYYIKKGTKIYQFTLLDLQENIENENKMMKTIVNTFKFIK